MVRRFPKVFDCSHMQYCCKIISCLPFLIKSVMFFNCYNCFLIKFMKHSNFVCFCFTFGSAFGRVFPNLSEDKHIELIRDVGQT